MPCFFRAKGDWQCFLCKSVEPIVNADPTLQCLSHTEKRAASRLLLEIYCQYDASLNLRQPIPPQVSFSILSLLIFCFVKYFIIKLLEVFFS